MEWLHIEPILTLIDFIDSGSTEFAEQTDKVFSSSLRKMFTQFHIKDSESRKCLMAALSRTEDLSGFSKDCTELLAYIEKIRERKEELKRFFEEISRDEEVIRIEAIARAKKYLPESVSFDLLNVFFLPMPYNANADHRGVYFDPIFAMDIGLDSLKGVMAHEAHHVGRNSITRERVVFDETPLDQLAYRFVCLETEGIANLVSSATSIPFMRKLAVSRVEAMESFESYLELLQEVFLNLINKNITDEEAVSLMNRSWFGSGKLTPVGMRMAMEIEEEYGTNALVNTVGDTVAFLEAYQKAALNRTLFLLENETLENLGKILTR